jgi:hypothetical protein
MNRCEHSMQLQQQLFFDPNSRVSYGYVTDTQKLYGLDRNERAQTRCTRFVQTPKPLDSWDGRCAR